MSFPATEFSPSPTPRFRRYLSLLSVCLIALFGFVTACGDGGNSGTTPPPTPATTVQVNLGDAPADWLLSFSTTITSMTLHSSNGSINVVTSATPVEFMQRMGTMEPFTLALANQGNYTSATIIFGNSQLTYIDPTTKTLQQKTIAGPITANVPFSSAVALGTTPLAFNFDLDLNHSLSTDNSGNFTFSPTFHFSFGAQGSGPAGGNGNGNGSMFGGMQHMFGVVSSVGNGYMVITSLQAMNNFTIQTNAQTQFHGLASSLSQLTTGMGVWVSATMQSDGTLLATRINAMMRSGGIMGGGIITNVTGTSPDLQLTLVMQNGAGATVNTSYLSKTLTVNLNSDTTYSIDDDRVDLTGLDFTPVFDANNIYAGQSVLPVDDSGNIIPGDTTSAGTITASSISLQEQGFRGTTDKDLTPGTATTFTLTLDPASAFAVLTGQSTIKVYQQTGTNLQYQTAIPAGSTVRVHGLLFKDASGNWLLVASCIAST